MTRALGPAVALLVAVVPVAAGALVAGCEVSFFGNDPVVLAGTSTNTEGSEAQACSEPDDMRRAREDAEACAERCRIEEGFFVGACEAVTLADHIATIDLSDADGLVMQVELCDPTGTSFELGDARTLASSAKDARVVVEGNAMSVHAASGSGVETSRVSGWVAETGCTTRTISLTDQLVYFAETEAGLCGPAMLRINPPTDEEGTPDALWHLALGRALEGDATGTVPRAIDLCFW